jgi:hypothetical protein
LSGLYDAGVTRRLVALQMDGGAEYLATVQRIWDDGDAVAPLPVDAPRPHLERLLATLAPQVLIDAVTARRRRCPAAGASPTMTPW